METAKPGSKLAQLQGLREQKQQGARVFVQRLAKAGVVSEVVSHTRAEVLALQAEIKRLKRQLVDATRPVDTTRSSKECPVCKARRAVKAKAQKAWRKKASG